LDPLLIPPKGGKKQRECVHNTGAGGQKTGKQGGKNPEKRKPEVGVEYGFFRILDSLI
jgi:hypothetical protein